MTTDTTRPGAVASSTELSGWGATATTEPLIRRLGVTDTTDLVRLVTRYRAEGRVVVLTNGCFDVLHLGHVTYLDAAKRLGDVLIVAVNSDNSVRRRKGPHRPVNRAVDRAAVVAALGCVDHVVIFGEDDPCRIIRLTRPDIFVKGGDYTADTLPERDLVRRLGGRVRIVDFLPGRSTSAIIDRIATNVRSRHRVEEPRERDQVSVTPSGPQRPRDGPTA